MSRFIYHPITDEKLETRRRPSKKQNSKAQSPDVSSEQPEQIPNYLTSNNNITANNNTQGNLNISQPGDAFEQEADRISDQVMTTPDSQIQRKSKNADSSPSQLQPQHQSQSPTSQSFNGGRKLTEGERSFFEPRFGQDLGHINIHEGAAADTANKNLNARAFTLGNDIVMRSGEYSAQSESGKRLLSHELTHSMQQGNENTIRREVIEMEPMVITPRTMPSDLSSLSTPPPPGAMTMAPNTAAVNRNSQVASTPLPFTSGGWNGSEIANNLGQYDRIAGTDSDSVRCVQAVALVSHVLSGPAAVISYLSAIAAQAMLRTATFGTRERTALRVIEFVQSQIEHRRATYGDMYWAMEAVHDLFYQDDTGTPADTPDEARSQINPMFDLTHTMTNINTWCSTPAALMSQAATLNPGEQFMLNTWSVSFNYYFDMAGAAPTDQRTTYTQVDDRGQALRTVTINRIDTSLGKPTPSQIDTNRDSKSGHQMLIYKDAADNHIKMYEPELTTSGNHMFDLTNDQSVLTNILFHDQPAFELFRYVQLLGKISPGLGAASLSTTGVTP